MRRTVVVQVVVSVVDKAACQAADVEVEDVGAVARGGGQCRQPGSYTLVLWSIRSDVM